MPQPNILIFMTDHQRGDMALPDHPAVLPNLRRFAEEGVTFSEAYCPAAHCCPSRATFFSGLYPTGHGVWNNICNGMALSTGLNPGVRLFSEDLAEAGYDSVFSGKWHVSIHESPKDRGWEELKATAAAGAWHGARLDGMRKLAEQPEPTEREWGTILKEGYGTDLLFGRRDEGNPGDEDTANRVIEALPRLAEAGKPWAAYVGLNMPHAPYTVPQKYLDLYDLDDVPLPPSYGDDLRDKPNYYRKLRTMRFDQMSEEETRDAIRHFWAMCTYIDDIFGRVLEAVEATGQADDTLVLFTSDHGDYAGDHGLFHKGIPNFRGAYHVPAVVRWAKGVESPGRTVDEFVSLADFAPTFTELCGKTPDPRLVGRSLVPFLRGETPEDWRDEIHTQMNGVENYFTQRSVRTKGFRYTYNGFDFDELYDLRADPHETQNLIVDPAYDDAKRDLVRRMWRFALAEEDTLTHSGSYITVGLAPQGPVAGLRSP